MVLALRCKAVLAVEVTGVSDVQTQRLDYCVALFEVKGEVLVLVGRKELAHVLQLLNIVKAVVDFSFIYFSVVRVLFEHGGNDFLAAAVFKHLDHVICEVVNEMNAAAVNVEYDIVSVKFVLMNHKILLTKGKPLLKDVTA